MDNPIKRQVNEAFSKIIGELKKIGFDPYIDTGSNYIAIIIPASQFIDMIYRNLNMGMVRQYINLEVTEKAVGNKGYIIIKATYKMPNGI